MTKIQDFVEKIKLITSDDTFYTTILLVLVAVASFGLGRHSVEEEVINFNTIETDRANTKSAGPINQDSNYEALSTTTEIQYVASKNSNKYHLPWCSGAKRISEANKVYFSSKEEATAAGYLPASNCEGI